MYMKTKLPAPLGPPAQVSATAALVTSLSTRTERPVASARASRSGTRSQPGSSGGSTTVPAVQVDGAGRSDAQPGDPGRVHAGIGDELFDFGGDGGDDGAGVRAGRAS